MTKHILTPSSLLVSVLGGSDTIFIHLWVRWTAVILQSVIFKVWCRSGWWAFGLGLGWGFG